MTQNLKETGNFDQSLRERHPDNKLHFKDVSILPTFFAPVELVWVKDSETLEHVTVWQVENASGGTQDQTKVNIAPGFNTNVSDILWQNTDLTI